MAITSSDQAKSGMTVQEVGAMSRELAEISKSTNDDRRDMWRMGKIQELKVSV